MENMIHKAEGLLRMLSLLLSALTACLVGLDTQTKRVLLIERKATVEDLYILWVLTIVASIAAGYQFVQLCKWFFSAMSAAKDSGGRCNKCAAWVCLLLDQGVMYTMFAATSAGAQAAVIGVAGAEVLQWTKLCNIYTRFCAQIGGGVFCGLLASLAMTVLSSVSARRLFGNFYARSRAN